ncbi:3-oxoacyl-(acyl-carrier-protein) synthase [Desulfocurvibacter africanus PCS]|uniref:3-oxoacyl-[acyl-carrier-protein] synthase 1 n=1 Tax=Desulfocurvibacter africanus PCS TaxID=1262666 RepID=M5Q3E3_DESAF|nr:beta-ketoacyl-[acyl-carrier-protein] synthase family protein [Desulfocurvibacter africanus]EMG38298.1 3-oxoacyl-(acyl-carrier-protein) synthase [Desulfocurvibacter africanus PCS]
MYKVAITGIGIVSCLGHEPESVAQALYSGASGIVIDEERIKLGFRSPLTGRIRDFDPSARLSRKQLKSMTDFAIWAHAAAMDAVEMSGIAPEDLRNAESGLIFGNDSTCVSAVEQVEQLRAGGDTARIGSGNIFRIMNSTVTMNLNVLLGTRGACWTISSACSSGGHAVGQAADLIALGRQDRVICGGAQEITWQSICSFDGLGAFSTRVDAPGKASRPFDANRDGLVPGGGAAAIMLERWDLAEKRGARILGEVLSYGFSSDGEHLSKPSVHGLSTSMAKALGSAGLMAKDIDYICAHATSTPAGDAVEAQAIAALFGVRTPPISSLKSMTGHELWMSGASQVVYTTIMAMKGFLAANVNFECGDEHSSKLNIITAPLERGPHTALLNSAGFGGTNSSLVLRFA